MWVPFRKDKRGIESQLATNHRAHFHLTAELWPALKRAKGARVVNVSSQGHQFASFSFEHPNYRFKIKIREADYYHSRSSDKIGSRCTKSLLSK